MSRRQIGILYAVSALAVGLLMIASAFPQLREAYGRTPWDLNVDYRSAQAYLAHYSPFTPSGAVRSGVAVAGLSGFGHPPTTAFWALPLAGLEIHTAGHVLAGATCVFLFIQALVGLRVLGCREHLATAWLITTFVCTSSFMNYHFGVGQISGLIGALMFVGWWAARRDRDLLAGAALGAACTLKFFPGVMIIFLVVTRRWRAVAAAAAVYLAIAAVMTSRFGLSSWATFFAVQPRIADRWLANIQNQSVHGVIARFFEPACVVHGPVIRNVLLLSMALSGICVLGAAWLAWRSEGDPVTFDLLFSLFMVLSVVTSQWAWEHYAVIFVLPLMILASHVWTRWRSGGGLGSTATLAAILMAILFALRIDVHLKQNLQGQVLAGDRRHHLLLHVVDVSNWAPGVAMCGLLYVACWNRPRYRLRRWGPPLEPPVS